MGDQKHWFLFVAFLHLFLIYCGAWSTQLTVYFQGEKRGAFSAVMIGGKQYIRSSDIGQVIPNSTVNGTEILGENPPFVVRFHPNALFLSIEQNGDVYLYQMPYPVLKRDGEYFVPLVPLLDALASTGMIQYRIDKGAISLSSGMGVAQLTPFKKTASGEPLVVTKVVKGIRKGIYQVQQHIAIREQHRFPQLQDGKAFQRETIVPEGTGVEGEAVRVQHYLRQPEFLPPLFYQLPPGLKRFLPEIRTKKEQSMLEFPYPPMLASLIPVEWLEPEPATKEPVAITEVIMEEEKNTIVLYFKGNRAIAAYQRPEFQKNTLYVRIPDAKHIAGNLSELASRYRCQVSVEKIRNILRYTFVFPDEIVDVDYRRIQNSRALKFRVYFAHSLASVEQKLQKEQEKWKFDVIVLDPGHGGKDAGAIGVSGVKEKDVTLAIARKVGELIKKELPEVKVVYTRDSDEFVELYRRGQIANHHKGKLFVSIHCNSKPRKPDPARGCETYILRPGRNDDALEVAKRENAVIKLEQNQSRYMEITEEQIIIATMAQRAFVKFSELFANLLQKHVVQKTGLPDRGVHQAGFLVLVGASMPNVLFEAGFLSNPQDERFLASESGQKKIAEGIVAAIKEYITQYQQLLVLEENQHE